MKKITIENILLEKQIITKEQLNICLHKQIHTKQKIGQILIENKFIKEKTFYEILGTQLLIPCEFPCATLVNMELISRFNKEFMYKNLFIPLQKKNNVVQILIEDPLNLHIVHFLQNTLDEQIKLVLSSTSHIISLLNTIFNKDIKNKIMSEIEKDNLNEKNNIQTKHLNLSSIGNYFTQIIQNAIEYKCSDIHIEPKKTYCTIRFRVNGDLIFIENMELNIYELLIQHIKYITKLNLTEKRVPQDGRYEMKCNNKMYDMRISIIPTIYGEKMVFRLLNSDEFIKAKTKVDFNKIDYSRYSNIIKYRSGLVLVVGPTGSGKTTTLYSMIRNLNVNNKNLTTIEDPVEYKLNNINQIEVNSKVGMTFEEGLKSILRQDPDIIMIGEIRNKETADIAFKSALTGHLVLSTLHTKNTFSTITRLRNMGLESYALADGLVGIIAQRLVKKLCDNCKFSYINKRYKINEIKKLYKSAGCKKCNNTGFDGRIPIYEIMTFNSTIKEMILHNKPIETIKKYCISNKMNTLEKNGLSLVKTGVISLDDYLEIYYSIK